MTVSDYGIISLATARTSKFEILGCFTGKLEITGDPYCMQSVVSINFTWSWFVIAKFKF